MPHFSAKDCPITSATNELKHTSGLFFTKRAVLSSSLNNKLHDLYYEEQTKETKKEH